MNILFGVQISSWNAQGGFRYKKDCLAGMLSSRLPNILLIQEEGTIDGNAGGTGYEEGEVFQIGGYFYQCVIACADSTAKKKRCTTAIMVEKILLPHIRNAGWEINSVGRPMCYVDMASGVRIATVHAIANRSDSIGAVKGFISYLDTCGQGADWILMGDFNSEPWNYDVNRVQLQPNREQIIQYQGSSTRPMFCNLIADSQPTQGPAGTRCRYLDFAFTSDGHKFAVNGITNRMVHNASGEYCSDHNLIQLNVRI